ncbi:MAG: electron transfer flavoprotein subunit alpha/FixB family protein [bacterium]
MNAYEMKNNALVVAEHFAGEFGAVRLRPVTFELIAFARELSDDVKVVIIGDGIEKLAGEISKTAGADVIACRVPGLAAVRLASYNSGVYKSVLEELAAELSPSYICIAHSSQGADFAPGLAVRLKAACITGVSEIHKDENGVCFSRAVYNGKFNVKIHPETDTTVLTVQPGAFKFEKPPNPLPGNIETKTISKKPKRIKNIEIKTGDVDTSRLTDAKVIVAAGKGIGKKGKLKLIGRFAGLFPGSAVAGSRPLVDMGWMEHSHQVGLTGATVAPELYIACGISGSSQHVAGMKGSGFIVAINSDPNAAIFNVADVCIVEDVLDFTEAFMAIF